MAGSIGYNAKLNIATVYQDGKTIANNVFYSPPYKLTNYFRVNANCIEYIIMNASAGIMERDNYLMEVSLGDNSQLKLSTQSFEKIHAMVHYSAQRTTIFRVGHNASLKYTPLPTIPFAQSNFTQNTTIYLQDVTSKLIYTDIVASGRHLRGERFQYTLYKSLLEIYQMDNLVVYENNVFEPATVNINGIGMLENYAYMGNLILFGFTNIEKLNSNIAQFLLTYMIDGGLTTLLNGGYLIRGFANKAENIIQFFNVLIEQLE